MKEHHSFRLLLAFSLLPTLVLAQSNRHALLIAVGNYAPKSGWGPLASCRDAELIRNTLQIQGFESNNIQTLRDSEATRQGIDLAIQNLNTRVHPGDAVLLHFSGHGQQVADDNGDEPDGYDEAFVPYDSPMQFQAGAYEGANLLRDDALGQYILQLRKHLGPTGVLLVLIDACHSGTGARAETGASVRGSNVVMASAKYQQAHRSTNADPNGLEENKTEKTQQGAPVVAFFASSAHEVNYESRDENGQRVGAMSNAFFKAISKAKSTTTNRALFDQIKTEMYSHVTLQNPQAEGALDRRVLDGRIAGCPDHFEVKSVEDANTVLVAAGQLSGLTESAELGLYPIGTFDTSQVAALAIGKITAADPMECIVTLNRPTAAKLTEGAWVFLRSPAWSIGDLRVQVDLPQNTRSDSVLAALRRWQRVITVEKNSDFIITQCSKKANCLCVNARGQSAERIISDISTQPSQIGAAVMQALSELAMANFLRGLTMNDPALQLRMTITPERVDLNTNTASMHFRANKDTVDINIINSGTVGCYYTLIDILSDGQIQVILPNPGQTAADYYIRPGASQSFRFLFTPPLGVEVFKLISCREPIDLRVVLQTHGTSTRGSHKANLLETLLAQRYDTSSRNSTRGAVQLAPGSMSVATVAVQVE